eukprot:4635470-Ditylum_brightwellii.AAC.1
MYALSGWITSLVGLITALEAWADPMGLLTDILSTAGQTLRQSSQSKQILDSNSGHCWEGYVT